ncbi:iron complex transport system substrate-binding protein [Paenibacillaceae bacterium GAS479]|nr:iron complex transport system substrate-binding protein [Paenibacillaceae bacterium GAS479]
MFKKKGKLLFAVFMVVGLVLLSACTSNTGNNAVDPSSQAILAPQNTAAAENGNEVTFLTFKDAANQEVILAKKPERIVVLNTEALALFYQLGGKPVGLATAAGTTLPKGAETAENVGEIQAVSLEKIIALKPDLVIGQSFFHGELRKSLTASGIPLALTQIDTYDKIVETGKLFGQLLGKEQEASKALEETQQRIQSIVDKVPSETKSFAAITIMPMGISIQQSDTLTLDVTSRLKLKNVAADMPAGEWPGSVPYSLEALIKADPDFIFLEVHGTEEDGKKKLEEDMKSNPAWSSLRAVKEDRLSFLPSDFVNNPGLNIDQPFSYLAKLVYPDAYKE